VTLPYHLYTGCKAALRAAVADEKDVLAAGHWKTEAGARRHVGVIEGLEKAVALLQLEYEKLEKLEDDERDE
jgi:hypothetical protein